MFYVTNLIWLILVVSMYQLIDGFDTLYHPGYFCVADVRA